jgi:class 3 adenylate cyclase
MNQRTGEAERLPCYRTLLLCDVVGFGRRSAAAQHQVRQAVYEVLEKSFADAGVLLPREPWLRDRGDGALITLSSEVPPHRVIRLVVEYITAGLCRHNLLAREDARIQLRVAMHIGSVAMDKYGLSGPSFVHLARLLEAQAFKELFTLHAPTLGLVVSREVYHNVICSGLGDIEPTDYARLSIENKETTAEGWVYLSARRSLPLAA